jgi:hypothetical protein
MADDFIPTEDWQPYPEGACLPPGCEQKFDRESGATMVRLTKPEPPPAEPPRVAPDFASIAPAEGYETLGDYTAEVARLAKLPPHEYDRCRKDEAPRLEVRLSTLDKDVDRARPRDASYSGQGEDLVLVDPEPWPDPVDGAALLEEIEGFLRDHLALRPHDGTKIALWALHTYTFAASFITPRLAITSATKRCGKSTLVDILSAVCSRAISADSLTAAATFRVMALARPTLLIDEADTFLQDNEELRGILNSGHKATGSVIRAVEVDGEWVPRQFSTFGPCAIAMIGRLPGTLEDRAVHVVMKRAKQGEVKRSFRPDRAGELAQIRSQAARFAADHMIALGAAEPELPPGAFNRFADNWRPLAAIADAVGGRWPGLARAAILADLGAVEERELGQQLLEDVRTIFDMLVDADAKTHPAQKLASKTIVATLKSMPDRPWNEIGRAETPISEHKLARMLDPFGIAPSGSIRDAAALGGTSKGYKREAFVDAWTRYLPPEPPKEGFQTGTSAQPSKTAASSHLQTGTEDIAVPVRKSRKAKQAAACADVPVRNGGSGPEREKGAARASASVPFIITRAQKAELRALGLTDEEIRDLRPDEAQMILE